MMRFYNYIFAAGYENMIRNGEDFIPWGVPLGEVFSVMMLHIFTFFFLFERWELIEFTNTVSAFIIVCTSIGLLFYYLRHNRHRQIWLQYHDRLKTKSWFGLWFIYLWSVVISAIPFFLAAM